MAQQVSNMVEYNPLAPQKSPGGGWCNSPPWLSCVLHAQPGEHEIKVYIFTNSREPCTSIPASVSRVFKANNMKSHFAISNFGIQVPSSYQKQFQYFILMILGNTLNSRNVTL